MSQYMGFDCSTQKLKAVVIDEDLKVMTESEVNFDVQLPEFRTQGGVIKRENGTVTTPVLLWVKSLDLILDQLQLSGVDFSKIKAVAGAAQQHGSVYWQKGSRRVLENLDPTLFLHEQLRDCFAVKESPTWMDSSTTEYCKTLEDAVGGPLKLAEITGSRAYERFTGPQIAKMAQTRTTCYENCERVSLISNFMCSLFLGDYADAEYSDACGTNVMNIATKEWNDECLEALKAPGIKEKLGKPVPPRSNLGPISRYFVKRFGFDPSCAVISFAGDNPASFAGMRLSENDVVASLGTSDTIIIPLKKPRVFPSGHLMCSATEDTGYLGLACFKNGSLTRERIRDSRANKCWQRFETLLDSTPRGNFGNVGLFFDSREILPFASPGDFRWNSEGKSVNRFPSDEIEVRALIEGQFLARRVHAEDMGLELTDKTRIIATGGASNNSAILQVLADVFNAPVYTQACSNSAALGAAYISKAATQPERKFEDVVKDLPEPILRCKPYKDSSRIYETMCKRYRLLVAQIVD